VKGLKTKLPNIVLNGDEERRLPNTLSISFPRVAANLILSEIEEKVGASAGTTLSSPLN